jgi:hypothetical protein
MKKTIIFIIIALCSSILMAQSKSTISAVVGIDYSNRVLNNPSFSDETGKLNYRIGLNYNRKMTEKMWLEGGLRFSSIGYNGKKMTGLTYLSDILTGTLIQDPTSPRQLQFITDHLFIEIPIGIRYDLSQNKLKTYFTVGLSPNIYLTTKKQTITEFGSSTTYFKTTGIQKMTFSANVGFGVEYLMNQQYQIFAQPSFRYHFTNLGTGPIAEYLYNFGLELGIRRNLK